MKYFFDPHFHVMTLEHPNLLSFLSNLESGIPDLLTSGALSPSYILGGGRRSKGTSVLNRLTNTLTTFEQSIGSTFIMMENDLKGEFESREEQAPRPEKPYIRNNKMHMRSQTYDKIGLCPLLMDFSTSEIGKDFLYYPNENRVRILDYAADTIEGFEAYKKAHPDGLFEFFPFLGITPPVHDIGFIKDLLERFIVLDKKPKGEKQFWGVKLYPPLGYNPWPEEKKERAKVELIYEFCESNNIPIMTHCDDQGFRAISTKDAWKYTAPFSYKPVLARYPNLKIDFAHYGWQYNQLQKGPLAVISSLATKTPDSPWFYEVTELMNSYPNIYSDVSFSGSDPHFYEQLSNYIKNLDNPDEQETILARTMFGTDFSVNLIKVESYTSYYRLFEESPFSDEEIDRFVSVNPMRYLGLSD